MVKKSSKSKSKRTSIRKKHKIMAKVKAHNRKERKIQRKKAKENRAKGIKTGSKDPGVPASWPFRDEFLKEMAFEKNRILQQKKTKKEANAKLQQPQEEADAEMSVDHVEELAQDAQKRDADFDHAEAETTIEEGKNVGGRERFKDFRKLVMLADVVLEVLDARDPEGCRSEEAESCIQQSTPPKRLVFLLNKTDLIPREAVELWLKHLRQFAPAVAFKCSTQRQTNHLGQSKQRTMESGSSVCLGADNLVQLLKNYARNDGIKTSITVGIVGVPNVGKSSVINSLKRSKAVQAGNAPGITTSIQEVHLDKQIRLLDSPGVIFEKAQGGLQGTVKTTSISDPIGFVEGILEKVEEGKLREVYGIGDFDTARSFLLLVAERMGKLKKGGVPDVEAVATIVIQDWNNGKIPFYKLPPSQPAATEIRILDNWSAGFDPEEERTFKTTNKKEMHRSEQIFKEMDVGIDAPLSGALEAFGRLATIQETRAEVKKASEAVADISLTDPPSKDSPDANVAPEPVVRVLYKKGQNKKKKNGPVHEGVFNRIKPPAGLNRIEKRRKKRGKKKGISKMTSEIADKLRL